MLTELMPLLLLILYNPLKRRKLRMVIRKEEKKTDQEYLSLWQEVAQQ